MTSYQELLKIIEENRENKKNGVKIGIPYPFPKMEEELCGIQKGQVIGFSGSSGVGKSKVSRYMFIYNTIRFAIQNNYKLKIVYFLLEDTPERIKSFILSNYLYNEYKTRVSSNILLSRGKQPLGDKMFDRIIKAEYDLEKMFSYIDFVRDYTTPNQINNYLDKVANEYGHFTSVKEVVDNIEKEKTIYIPKDSTHVIAIVDNLSNILQDKEDLKEYDAVTRFVREIERKKYCDCCRFTVVNIIQQALAVDNQQFTGGGDLVVQKLIPSLATIGDNKIISRFHHLIFGLFSPKRFDIESFPVQRGYNINILGEHFRNINIMKNNDGIAIHTPIFYDGLTEHCEELPHWTDPTINEYYEYAKKFKQYKYFDE